MTVKKVNIIIILIVMLLLSWFVFKKGHHSQTPYSAKSLGITEIKSENDEDFDGINDYTDIWEGAKAYIATKPRYKSKYYDGGYPDDHYGVCTDVIWKALQAAGYDLKAMVDQDIADHQEAYPSITSPDPNIDFRRVTNLNCFLQRHAKVLTLSFDKPEEWQAGDIVVFTKHIAICSDIRNKQGIPFILHHDSRGAREANDITDFKLIGHYRFIYHA